MTQPKFAPIQAADEVRGASELTPAPRWSAHRPGEYQHGRHSSWGGRGVPGPDQGYALLLARSFVDHLVLTPGEYGDDAITAAVVIGLRRAAIFGRAPIRVDLEVGLELFGYLGEAPADLVAYRNEVVAGIAHDYRAQRELADSIPVTSLSARPEEIRHSLADWPTLVGHALSQ